MSSSVVSDGVIFSPLLETRQVAMTGGEAVVSALLANGVDTLFGLPGAQTYGLFDALYKAAPAIRTVSARHEQACGYMAYGYARSTGRPGVFSVVPGPGFLNACAALCTAWGANVPVLCVTAQVPSSMIGRRRGALHELPDQLATAKSIVKWAERIERPADAPSIVNEAFRRMTSGRPGPVVLEIPWDVMEAREIVVPGGPATFSAAPPPRPEEISAAARLLSQAKKPLIITGSGALDAQADVIALAERLNAPVTSFRGGRGIVPEDHALGISSYAAYKLWPDTDVLLGIGTRLELPYMRWTWGMDFVDVPPAPPYVIRIDIDPAEMHRLRPHVGILGDAADCCRALLSQLGQSPVSPPRSDRVSGARKQAAAQVAAVTPHIDYLNVIREILPDDGFIVPELSQIGFTTYFGFEVRKPRTYVTEGFQGTLGFGFPTALGVKVANPDKPVISLTGDGGFMFAVGELATAVHENIGLIVIISNNNAYHNVRRDQRNRFGGREIAVALTNPDFVALGRSFGVDSHRVTSPADLKPVLRSAMTSQRLTLIELVLGDVEEVSPWDFIHPPK